MNMDSKEEIIKFTRSQDFIFERFLDKGRGATGETALLRDDTLDRHFVCKKYAVDDPLQRRSHFERFVEEVKFLFEAFHPNVVRIFSFHLYPTALKGFILMEFVNGSDIRTYLEGNPDKTDSLFRQAISAFGHLEEKKILHRDIRPSNIMVTNEGILKVIDFGFGKSVTVPEEYRKSVSLNWPASVPKEFESEIYDFGTECYFLGKLFGNLISQLSISSFSYNDVLRKMCEYDPSERFESFQDVSQTIAKNESASSRGSFSDEDREIYLEVADFITGSISVLYSPVKFQNDPHLVSQELRRLLDLSQLETKLQDVDSLLSIFVMSNFDSRKADFPIRVAALESFYSFYQRLDIDRRLIVLSNLHLRLGTIRKVDRDEIPF